MDDNRRAAYPLEKSQDATREWHVWLYLRKQKPPFWQSSYTVPEGGQEMCGCFPDVRHVGEGQHEDALIFSQQDAMEGREGPITESVCVKWTIGEPGASGKASSHHSSGQTLQKQPRRGSPKPQPNHTEKGISSKHLKGPESMEAVHSITSQQPHKNFPDLLPHLSILLNFDPAVSNWVGRQSEWRGNAKEHQATFPKCRQPVLPTAGKQQWKEIHCFWKHPEAKLTSMHCV